MSIRLIVLSLTKKMWPIVSVYACVGMLSALVAFLLKDSIPFELSVIVNAETLNSILTILASTMLAVTTFSLSTMVSAYGAATAHATPRASSLITADRTTQNALSTFMGAFIFSLVGIIALNMGLYEGGGRFLLLVLTLGIITLIIVMLIRWIERLTSLGRVGEVSALVEREAAKALALRARRPTLGCNRLGKLPERYEENQCINAESTGYVRFFNSHALHVLAEEEDVQVYLLAMPGKFVNAGGMLATSSAPLSEAARAAMQRCFSIGDQRSFEQDSRFGICVLAEIATRAVSAAVNDSGTAIDIVGRLGRVLGAYVEERNQRDEVTFARFWVPELRAEDLFQDAFAALMRDAAGIFEVQSRIQKVLGALASKGEDFREQASAYAVLALSYSDAHLFLPEEKQALWEIAAPLVQKVSSP